MFMISSLFIFFLHLIVYLYCICTVLLLKNEWLRISSMSVRFVSVIRKVGGYTTKLIFHTGWFLPSQILCCFREIVSCKYDALGWFFVLTCLIYTSEPNQAKNNFFMCPINTLTAIIAVARDGILYFRICFFPSRSMFYCCFP